MKSTDKYVDWADVLAKFNTYDGTIVSFCEKHTINQHQLYYQRKKAELTTTTFVSIPLEVGTDHSVTSSSSTIDIAIGKATLKIPTINKDCLRLVLKTLLDVC